MTPSVSPLQLHSIPMTSKLGSSILRYLVVVRDAQVVSKEEASKMRAQVFHELGWHHLVEADKKWAILSQPKDFPLF